MRFEYSRFRTGGYALGFILMALVAVACLIVLGALRVPQAAVRPRRTFPLAAEMHAAAQGHTRPRVTRRR